MEGDASTLELGQEVEYTLGGRSNSGSCLSAEAVKLLPKGTVQLSITIGEEVLDGQVMRPLRSVNPDQSEYAGLITTDPGNFQFYFVIKRYYSLILCLFLELLTYKSRGAFMQGCV